MNTPVQDAKAGKPLTVGDMKQGVDTLRVWTTILKKALVSAHPVPKPGSDEGMAITNLTDAENNLTTAYQALGGMDAGATVLVDYFLPNGAPRLIKGGDC